MESAVHWLWQSWALEIDFSHEYSSCLRCLDFWTSYCNIRRELDYFFYKIAFNLYWFLFVVLFLDQQIMIVTSVICYMLSWPKKCASVIGDWNIAIVSFSIMNQSVYSSIRHILGLWKSYLWFLFAGSFPNEDFSRPTWYGVKRCQTVDSYHGKTLMCFAWHHDRTFTFHNNLPGFTRGIELTYRAVPVLHLKEKLKRVCLSVYPSFLSLS